MNVAPYELNAFDKKAIQNLLESTIIPSFNEDLLPNHDSISPEQEAIWPEPLEIACAQYLIELLKDYAGLD